MSEANLGVSSNRSGTRLATRLAFLVAGFSIASWAPLVPFTKSRLGVDDTTLGLLLLCIGLGSVLAMLLAGMLTARYGSKPVIVAGGVGLVLTLPFLTVVNTPAELGIALFLFGASLGSLEVAMNVHAVEVERDAGRPLMSGFHALFSVGGFAGSSLMTFLLSMHVGTLAGTLLCSALVLGTLVLATPRLLPYAKSEGGPIFAVPRGIVLLLAILAAITFLAEGAVLDWSALLVSDTGLVGKNEAGLGYVLFSIAMTGGRLCGDAVIKRLGERAVMFWGGVLTIVGFVLLLTVPIAFVALGGFVLVGLGASNTVPILYRRSGTQRLMPPALAVAAVTIVGYAGILSGPAGIGFIAGQVGLPGAFWVVVVLLCLVPLCARTVTAKQSDAR
ncbi:MFS transporter [Caballeronia sp. HLA56]|jgi:predicted MFS family arabinose efflux permease|uniref:MFS transporter n=1 Tax=unclassified Caballeronia TaxID=2646786 RepID=UPI001FD213F0|nr:MULTISPECIES: MFS transporter [unclassified Caballeronia]